MQWLCEQPKGWFYACCVHGARAWIPMRCRHCEGCYNWRAQCQVQKTLKGMKRFKWKAFLTLTTTGSITWTTVMKYWTRLVARLRKDYGRIQYVAVKEEGSVSGMKHLHLILCGPTWIPWAYLSKAWFTISGAWVVNVQRVSNNLVARYVSKYVAKGQVVWGKVWTCSSGWPREPFTSSMLWVKWLTREEVPAYLWWQKSVVLENENDCECFGGPARSNRDPPKSLAVVQQGIDGTGAGRLSGRTGREGVGVQASYGVAWGSFTLT